MFEEQKIQVIERLRKNRAYWEKLLVEEVGLSLATATRYFNKEAAIPFVIVEQLAIISGKPIEWFYCGELEAVIQNLLQRLGQEKLVAAHPEIIPQLKKNLLEENPDWQAESGLSPESYLIDDFVDIESQLMRDYFFSEVKNYLSGLTEYQHLNEEKQMEIAIVLASEVMNYNEEVEKIYYGEAEKVHELLGRLVFDHSLESFLNFDDSFLVGKLINTLKDYEATEQLINYISRSLTDKSFSTVLGGEELVTIFRSIRPALIQLYREKGFDDYYTWFN